MDEPIDKSILKHKKRWTLYQISETNIKVSEPVFANDLWPSLIEDNGVVVFTP